MSTIDTSIQAHATGAAANLTEAHKADHPLKLYAGWFCPFVQRAWIVLEEKSIPYQYVEINPYKKDPSFLALNPRGLVPTIAVPPSAAAAGRNGDGGGVGSGSANSPKPLYESTVICEYLDEAYPGSGSSSDSGPGRSRLLPADAYERARCRLWIDHTKSRIIPAFYKLLQHTPGKSTYTIDEARSQLHEHLKTFAREMAPAARGPWFLGEEFSLVDVMLAPWAIRLFLIDHYKPGGVGIPAKGHSGEDKEVWERWERWAAAIEARKSVVDTRSDDDEYIKVYKRYADDTTQSEVGQATRQGGSLP